MIQAEAPLARWSIVLFACLTLMASTLASGCNGEEAPAADPPTPHTESASLENVEVSVKGTRVITPEVVDPEGHAAMITAGTDRVFAVDLEFKNTGDAAVPYRPAHNAATGQPDTTPLLFKVPSGDDKLTPIPSVRLGESYFLVGQTQSATDIAPGKSQTDTYIFRVPTAEETDLMLTVPASLVGGSAGNIARFSLPNEPKIEPAPSPGELGKPYKKGPLEVTVKSVKDEYTQAELVSSKPGQDELKYPYAYTVEPILAIEVELKNTGSDALYYDPGHRANDSRGVELTMAGNKRALKRFKLANAEAAAKGQIQQATALEPGKTYNDVYLFQRPPTAGDAELNLAFSGHIFGVEGLLEFKLPYKRTEPPKPDLEPYKKEKKPEPTEN